MPTFFLAPTANYTTKTLSGAIDDTQTTITLNNTTNMTAPGYVVINRENSSGTATPDSREVVSYTGISGSDLTGCTRGADGSTARTHADSSLVETMPTVGMWNNLATIVSKAVTSDGYLKAINSPVSIARGQFTQFVTTSIASIARLEVSSLIIADIPSLMTTSIASIAQVQTARLFAGAATVTNRLSTGQVAFPSTASAATSEFDIRNQDGHLDIRAGTSKLVKISVLRQNAATDGYVNSNVILTGFHFEAGNGSTAFLPTGGGTGTQKTFGITFSAVPIVVISNCGYKDGSDPSNAGDFTAGQTNLLWGAQDVDVTGFKVYGQTIDATNVNNGRRVGYHWIAIGQL